MLANSVPKKKAPLRAFYAHRRWYSLEKCADRGGEIETEREVVQNSILRLSVRKKGERVEWHIMAGRKTQVAPTQKKSFFPFERIPPGCSAVLIVYRRVCA